jgi:hypothetical protein
MRKIYYNSQTKKINSKYSEDCLISIKNKNKQNKNSYTNRHKKYKITNKKLRTNKK